MNTQYKLPTHIDPDKVFIVNRSELEGRFDPKYAEPNRMSFYDKLKASPNIVRLKEVIKEGSYGVLPPGDSYDDKNPIKFIRATELKEDLKIDFENVYYVEEQYYSRRAAIKQNDILLAVKGATIASNKCVAYVQNNLDRCIVNGSIFRFQTKSNALPQYVAYLLESPLLKKQMRYNLVANNAVDYLDKYLINNLLIPLPFLEVQQQIVDLYQEVYNKKQQKETEAKDLLDGIDSYLLNELGITLPEKDNSLEKRVFTTHFSEVTGGRLDPFYNEKFYKKIIKQIDECNYPTKKIHELVYGVSGVVYSSEDETATGLAILRANNISLENNELNFESIRYIKDDIHLSENLKLRQNDILMCSASGSKEHVGKVAFIENDMNYYFGGFMMVLRQKSEDSVPRFMFEFLQSAFFRMYLFRNLGGTNINNLNFNMLRELQIPLSPIEKQNEIVQHIQSIREQAKQLQDDAKAILEQAKKEVEEMILG